MRRRELLAGLGGAAVVGAGGYIALSSAGGDVTPVEVDLFDTPGSPGGEMTVPVPGQTTVVDLFATTCPPCKPALDSLSSVESDARDVQFVSVTGEYLGDASDRTRSDVIEWWRTHGGRWPVGHDAQNALSSRFDATGLPFTAVVDATGSIVWSHTGVPDADRVDQAIDEANA
ncbi:TlpA family protein disulfide reductase [Halorhabdus amylolytica]|uniref:TlpA family protein disulfide reductase n=1 Tax=Halorhabdus amylolytica TaxID=2559573 RepID=UPI0010AA357B|nr:TlpA disulfide reductase family protein [Halorhabdus amylolytica]